jgi:hypothetical protein
MQSRSTSYVLMNVRAITTLAIPKTRSLLIRFADASASFIQSQIARAH